MFCYTRGIALPRNIYLNVLQEAYVSLILLLNKEHMLGPIIIGSIEFIDNIYKFNRNVQAM